MRIAIYHNLPSGGAIRSLAGQAQALAGRHHLDLYTLSTSEHELEAVSRFVGQKRVFAFSRAAHLGRPLGMLNPVLKLLELARLDRLQGEIARQIDRERYDVVFVHPCQFTQAPLLLRHLTGTACYYCQEPPRALYENPPGQPGSTAMIDRLRQLRNLPLDWLLRHRLRSLDRQCCARAAVVLVNSCFSREVAYRIYGLDTRVVYHGVDTEFFSPPPQEARRERFVLSVGAFSRLKGFDLIVEAVGAVPKDDRPGLVLVSDRGGDLPPDQLQQRAVEVGVDLRVMMRVTDDVLRDLYRRAAAVVYAPVMEPFGLVPLEAMACGTPVIGVREGGVRETIVHGVTGLLCDRDAPSLAAGLKELTSDDRRRAAMGQAGRLHALENWAWSRTLERLEQALFGRAGAIQGSGIGPALREDRARPTGPG
ncbi:MAG: glycosyltransferase family 4 protein [Candidatus Riflebacteria bacterium]|nr:glycosyltransferase family 4 protein [Candidatus Riflebacteria bacterium]